MGPVCLITMEFTTLIQVYALLLIIRTGWKPLLGWCILSRDPFPYRLSFQTTKSKLHYSHLSPKHQFQREYMPGYPARPVESCFDHIQRQSQPWYVSTSLEHWWLQLSSSLDLLYAHRPQPGWPSCSRDCTRLQDWSLAIRIYGQGMDSKVCHLETDRDEAFRSRVRVFQHCVVGLYDKNLWG